MVSDQEIEAEMQSMTCGLRPAVWGHPVNRAVWHDNWPWQGQRARREGEWEREGQKGRGGWEGEKMRR